MLDNIVDSSINCCVGFFGGSIDLDIVARGGKCFVGVHGDEQEKAGRDGVGREAEEEELHATGTSSCGARRGDDVRGSPVFRPKLLWSV